MMRVIVQKIVVRNSEGNKTCVWRRCGRYVCGYNVVEGGYKFVRDKWIVSSVY